MYVASAEPWQVAMMQWIERTLKSPAFLVGVAGFFIAGMVFLVRLDNDVRHLQDDVAGLQTSVAGLQASVAELQVSMGEIKANQQRILDSLEQIEFAIGNHVHNADGTVSVPLRSD